MPDTAIIQNLRHRAGPAGLLSFRDFSEVALYAPEVGYYTRDAARVGKRAGTDFYTSASLGPLFGRLIRAALLNLLGGTGAASGADLVELGAEPGQSMFPNPQPFHTVRSRRYGDTSPMPARAALFGNEVLDAQPFHRFHVVNGKWRERGVQITPEGTLCERDLPEASPEAEAFLRDLPERPDGYALDISLDAERLLRELCAGDWQGALVLADYGYGWTDLLESRPHGTARAYFRHEVSQDLLANPGQQDLTCHVCWDRLIPILQKAGFENVTVQRQEAFLVEHAAPEIERIISTRPGSFSMERQALHALLSPGQLGHRFQVLHGVRQTTGLAI